MNASGWEHDGRLLAALKAVVGARGRATRPTPASYTESALAAFAIGQVDAATGLAELVFDSACDPEPAGMTRALGSARLLAFRAAGYAVDVEIGPDALLGQVHADRTGAAPVGSVTGQTAQGVFGEAALDEVGGFSLPLPPAGPIRLRANLADHTVVTSWLVLRYPTG